MSEHAFYKLLGPDGKLLADAVLAENELTAGELELLSQACRTADLVALMEETVFGSGSLVVQGSTGQPRAHPLLAGLAEHRRVLAALLAQLDLPEAQDAPAEDDVPDLGAWRRRNGITA